MNKRLDSLLEELESACESEAASVAETIRDGIEGLTSKESVPHARAMAKQFIASAQTILDGLKGA